MSESLLLIFLIQLFCTLRGNQLLRISQKNILSLKGHLRNLRFEGYFYFNNLFLNFAMQYLFCNPDFIFTYRDQVHGLNSLWGCFLLTWFSIVFIWSNFTSESISALMVYCIFINGPYSIILFYTVSLFYKIELLLQWLTFK